MKIILLYLIGFLLLDVYPLLPNSSKAETLNRKILLEKNYNKFRSLSNKSKRIKNLYFENDLLGELKFGKNDFISHLISINNNENNISELDIESNIQYTEEDIFYAEGNVLVYLGDLTLRADKIQFNKNNKKFVAEGNVTFEKGSQYFEASNLEYNLDEGVGFIENIYGVLDIENFKEDINLKSTNLDKNNENLSEIDNVSNLEYINSAVFGLANDFEGSESFNNTDLELDIPPITKWRFKSKKIIIKSKSLLSNQVFFTNDPYNYPQFILESKNFSAEIINDELKLISRNSWIKLDEKINFPIGRRTISDNQSITRWGIGSDYSEKDGFYISREFDTIDIGNTLELNIKPYFLIQRSIKDSTNSFVEKESSIFSQKVKSDINFLDTLALDLDLSGKFQNWDLELNQSLNSLNSYRLSESLRSKLTLSKAIYLKEAKGITNDKLKTKSNNSFESLINLEFANSFREEISRGYSGDSEIYFGNSLSIANKNSWKNYNTNNDLALIYSLGEFKAKARDKEELTTLFRNVFAFTYDNEFPIFKKKSLDQNINENYKYSSQVIDQGIILKTNIKAGTFLYSDQSNQSAITLATGPEITFGSFIKDYFDYTKLKLKANYTLKNGKSPFVFDNVDDTFRIQYNLEQQIFGPLVFNFETYLNLEKDDADYGNFEKFSYGLDIKRRAYNLGLYYKPESETVGFQFQIFNFNYSGNPKKF